GPADLSAGTHLGEVAHPAQQAVGDTRRTTGATGNLEGALGVERQPENTGRTADDSGQVFAGVELQTLNDAETIAQRVGQHAGAGSGADQSEGRQIELDRTRRGALADHDVELEILHG